mmetsp:Transcript_99604/g.213362  ORF Transcript_99604/g.213362 Transcript_99604/m.213362 type:complete len:225 (-) Transcript_99604:267-941(-)
MLMSPRPLRSCATSVGERRLRSSWSTSSGTTLHKPRCIAAIWLRMAPKSRHSASALTKSALFSSVTNSSAPPWQSATSAEPTWRSGCPGQARTSPGRPSPGATSAGSEAVCTGASIAAAPAEFAELAGLAALDFSLSWLSRASSRASSLASESEKSKSKPNSATGCASNHFTFSRSISSSTSARVVLMASASKPKRRAQTWGCNGRSSVQLCHSARPNKRPSAS